MHRDSLNLRPRPANNQEQTVQTQASQQQQAPLEFQPPVKRVQFADDDDIIISEEDESVKPIAV